MRGLHSPGPFLSSQRKLSLLYNSFSMLLGLSGGGWSMQGFFNNTFLFLSGTSRADLKGV